MDGVAKCGLAACCGSTGAAGQYFLAPTMAGLTQQVGERTLGLCGASVPHVGIELARQGAEKLLGKV